MEAIGTATETQNQNQQSTQKLERQSTLIPIEYQYDSVKKRMAAKFQENMHVCGVPKRFLSAAMTDFDAKHQKQFRTDTGLYLYGPRGCGKTHAMAALMRKEILDTEPNAFIGQNGETYFYESSSFPFFISVSELLLKIRETFGRRYFDAESTLNSEGEIHDKYSKWTVLFLDDLGAEKASDWSIATLYLLINRRYENELRTVISSNLSLDELADRLDDRISSRIAGMCEVIEMTGKDRRRQRGLSTEWRSKFNALQHAVWSSGNARRILPEFSYRGRCYSLGA
jgi:DNA replication protein DnaC